MNLSIVLRALFFILSAGNITAVALQSQWGIFLTKPLLLTTLSCWFFIETKESATLFSKLVLLGLIFSIFGDTLLMFSKPETEHFFLAGLGSFLLAHLFYITAFTKFPAFPAGFVLKKRWPVIPFVLFLIGFCGWIWKGLPLAFKLPVVVYAFVIVLMALSSLNMKERTGQAAAGSLFIGAILFMVSDSAIALKKFKFHDGSEVIFGLFIMATYLMGQYLIASGASVANKEIVKVKHP